MALPGRSRHYRLAEIQRRHWKALAETYPGFDPRRV